MANQERQFTGMVERDGVLYRSDELDQVEAAEREAATAVNDGELMAYLRDKYGDAAREHAAERRNPTAAKAQAPAEDKAVRAPAVTKASDKD